MPKSTHEAVVKTSLLKAHRYLTLGKYGRAFAHYLTAFTLRPSTTQDTKILEDFSFALGLWGQQLEEKKKIREIFQCYKQALDLFPSNNVILINFGAHLFRLHYLKDATSCFRIAIAREPHSIVAQAYLDNLNNALIERWHFSMLNCVPRNLAYKAAIEREVCNRNQTILDIGSGTGILSLIAAASGSQQVFACEVSEVMNDIAAEVIQASGLEGKIRLINLKSTELNIPLHIPERVSVVVTETFDAGLFGEHILETLIHAWTYLLQPAPGITTTSVHRGCVIPSGATVWACLIECDKVRQYSRWMPASDGSVPIFKVPIFAKGPAKDYYTTERLSEVRHGFKPLSSPIRILDINFNDITQLLSFANDWSRNFTISPSRTGVLDAVAVWFDLYLDEFTQMSTSPAENSCWEQAIFPVAPLLKNELLIKENMTVCIQFSIGEALQLVDIIATHQGSTLDSAARHCALTPDDILLINDNFYLKSLERALVCASSICENKLSILVVSSLAMCAMNRTLLDMCELHHLNHPCSREGLFQVVKEVGAYGSELGSEEAAELMEDKKATTLNVLMADVVQPNGIISGEIVAEIALLRESHLTSPFCIIPSTVKCIVVLIESDILSERNSVLSNDRTLGFEIAPHINVYKALHHIDIDLFTLPHKKLTVPKVMLELDFTVDAGDEGDSTPPFLNCHKKLSVEVSISGKATAIAYWFELQLAPDIIVTTASLESHWDQAAFMLNNEMPLNAGQHVTLTGDFVSGHLRLALDKVADI